MKNALTVEEAAGYIANDISEIKKRLHPYVDRLMKHGNYTYSNTEKLVIRKMYKAVFFEKHMFSDNPSSLYKRKQLAGFGNCSSCTRVIIKQLDLFLEKGMR